MNTMTPRLAHFVSLCVLACFSVTVASVKEDITAMAVSADGAKENVAPKHTSGSGDGRSVRSRRTREATLDADGSLPDLQDSRFRQIRFREVSEPSPWLNLHTESEAGSGIDQLSSLLHGAEGARKADFYKSIAIAGGCLFVLLSMTCLYRFFKKDAAGNVSFEDSAQIDEFEKDEEEEEESSAKTGLLWKLRAKPFESLTAALEASKKSFAEISEEVVPDDLMDYASWHVRLLALKKSKDSVGTVTLSCLSEKHSEEHKLHLRRFEGTSEFCMLMPHLTMFSQTEEAYAQEKAAMLEYERSVLASIREQAKQQSQELPKFLYPMVLNVVKDKDTEQQEHFVVYATDSLEAANAWMEAIQYHAKENRRKSILMDAPKESW